MRGAGGPHANRSAGRPTVTEMQMQSTTQEGHVVLARMVGAESGGARASGAVIALAFVGFCMAVGGALALFAAGLVRLQWQGLVTALGGVAFYILAVMLMARAPGPRWPLANASALRARLKTLTYAGMLGRPVRARGQLAWLTDEGLLGHDLIAYRWEEFAAYRLAEDRSGFLQVELARAESRTKAEKLRSRIAAGLTLSGSLLPLVAGVVLLVEEPLRLDGLGALLMGVALTGIWSAVAVSGIRRRFRRSGPEGEPRSVHLLIDPEQFPYDEVRDLLEAHVPGGVLG